MVHALPQFGAGHYQRLRPRQDNVSSKSSPDLLLGTSSNLSPVIRQLRNAYGIPRLSPPLVRKSTVEYAIFQRKITDFSLPHPLTPLSRRQPFPKRRTASWSWH